MATVIGTSFICHMLASWALYIEDMYFFEVNTKYISSNVLEVSVISRVHSTSETSEIFNTGD